jgi:hypothetical protein
MEQNDSPTVKELSNANITEYMTERFRIEYKGKIIPDKDVTTLLEKIVQKHLGMYYL